MQENVMSAHKRNIAMLLEDMEELEDFNLVTHPLCTLKPLVTTSVTRADPRAIPLSSTLHSRGTDYTGSAEHKRASAMPSQGSLFTNFEDVQLTDEERVYLNAASLGDVGIVRMSLEEEGDTQLNADCVDYMGRNALHLAIDSEKIEVIELILDNLSFGCIEEALLHAISKGAVKIVKLIIEHPNFMAGEDRFKRSGVNEAFFRTEEKSQFSPDITPIILAGHYNNHEIIQMFLSRNHRIEKPHPISCTCTDCVTKQNYDSLKRSRSRLNAYRALASPAYMALSSPDPIMTTFELRQEMMHLAEVEKEFMCEYLSLVEQCMNFAYAMMDLCRGTQEVEAVLSEGTGCKEGIQRDPLARLKMAIRYMEKKFVAHPNCQQHMTNLWYGSEMGFLQSLPWWKQLAFALLFLPCIPFMCLTYVIAPNTKAGSIMRCPVTKFITHTTSHMVFLVLLAAATFRLTESGLSITTTKELNSPAFSSISHEEKIQSLMKETLRPSSTLLTHVQICIVFWILGLLWIECKQVYNSGARSYFTDYINFMDFSVLSMYLASYVLRLFTEYKVSEADRYFNGTERATQLLKQTNYTYFDLLLAEIKDPKNAPRNYFMEASRFHWKPDDPEIVSDVLFAIANVISIARTTYLMPAFEVLGPLQISLGRMIGDITRFMVLFMLVLFAFMVGLHNLYWYYGAQRIKMMMNGQVVYVHAAEAFQGLRQTFSSLFWSMFGQVSINDINVKHPGPEGVYNPNDPESFMKSSTAIVEGVGLSLFGIYHVVIIIVLINMLIAMMSHSFEDIQTDCDVEWKFARTKLWLNYQDEGSTLPVPFNMIPSPKSFCYLWRFFKELLTITDKNWLEYQKTRKQTFIKLYFKTVWNIMILMMPQTNIMREKNVLFAEYVRLVYSDVNSYVQNMVDEEYFKALSEMKRRENVCKNLELKTDDTSYSEIMQRLVKRYLFKLERARDEKESVKDGVGNLRPEEVEIVETQDTPPPVPNAPNRIPYATPPTIPEDDADDKNQIRSNRCPPTTKRKAASRIQNRRVSNPAAPTPTTLVIPQLDAIQRSQKLLDVRLQHLQANSKQNDKIIDDIEFLRRVMTENQKALYNIIQALGNMQCEIVNLVKCFAPIPSPQNQISTTTNTHTQSNAHSTQQNSISKYGSGKKRLSRQEDDESEL